MTLRPSTSSGPATGTGHGEAGRDERRLGLHDGPARAGIDRRAVDRDREAPVVGRPHAVDRVDPAGAEQDLGDPARAGALDDPVEPRVGLRPRRRAEDRRLDPAEAVGFGGGGQGAPACAFASSSSAKRNDSENVGNGWIVSRMTSSGTRARIASVACCSHSPASGPTA